MSKIFLTLLLFFCVCLSAQAQTDQRPAPFQSVQTDRLNDSLPHFLQVSRPYAEVMFDRQNHVTDKALQQLKMRQDNTIHDGKFIVGGRFQGHSMYERTNTRGKFPILSRLPPAHTNGKDDFVNIVQDASVQVTYTPLPFVTGFVQGEYSESVYPGQERHQWRKYWVTLGDLDVAPVYLTFGTKTVSFGDMSSYAPFTHSHNAHYFWAQNEDDPLIELGYAAGDWHITGTLIKNDRGTRVLNAPQGRDGFENFAANITRDFTVGTDYALRLGGGFLRGTIYDSTLAHHPPGQGLTDRSWNSAYNAHAVFSGENFDLMTEFSRTVDKWSATDAHVHALTVQGRYFDWLLDVPVIYSLMWSDGVQGNSGDEWQRMMQTVAGFEMKIHPNIGIGLEYVNNIDFVPLILPRITADDGVVSHSVIGGVKVTF